MATTLGKSTYAQLIDDVVFSVNKPELSTVANEAYMAFILEAQKRICELFRVREKYQLRLTTDVTDYNIQDRPRITAATNATPIVGTAASHGLSNDDRIFIRDVLGNTATNGYRQVASVATNTFALYDYADIDTAVAGASTVTITTKKAHPFSNSDSVTIASVLGMTDINGTHTITYVDSTSFTVPITTTQTYTSGGVCTKPVAGNGTYTSGGKFWKENEIPTIFRPDDYEYIERTWGNYFPRIDMVSYDHLLSQKSKDENIWRVFSDFDAPFMAAEWVSAGQRVLTVYPAPQSDQDVWIFGNIQVDPRLYYSDTVSDYVQLPSQFDEAITAYTKAKISERFGDIKMVNYWKKDFDAAIARLRLRSARHTTLEVTYT